MYWAFKADTRFLAHAGRLQQYIAQRGIDALRKNIDLLLIKRVSVSSNFWQDIFARSRERLIADGQLARSLRCIFRARR